MDLTQLTDEQFEAEMKRRQAEKQSQKEEAKKSYIALKQDTLTNLCNQAIYLNNSMKEFKEKAFGDMGTLYALLQEYSDRHKDGKGNFKIENNHFKITYKKQGKPSFDERADQAEKHIVEFLTTRYSGDEDTKDLIMSLLERKKGELDIALIQKLYQMEDRFDNENWKRGIELLKESYTYSHSKDYIRFEQKDENGQWQNINLQFSSI